MNSSPQKLAVIGGAGPYASALFYERLLTALYEQEAEIPELVIFNHPFTEPFACKDPLLYAQMLCRELQQCMDAARRVQCTHAVIICNTLHTYIHAIKKPLRLFHLPRITVQTISSLQKHKLLILGTPITIENKLYTHEHFTSIAPNKAEQGIVNEIIQHILDGTICVEDAIRLQTLIEQIHTQTPFDGVILGCTELPVLHHRFPLQAFVKIFDPLNIVAKYLTNKDSWNIDEEIYA